MERCTADWGDWHFCHASEVFLLKKDRLQLTSLLELDGITPSPRLGQDARQRMARLQAQIQGETEPEKRARLYTELARACFDAGEMEAAEENWAESLSLCEKRGDERGAVRAQGNLGLVAMATGHMEEAAVRLYRAQTIYKRLKDLPGLADTYLRLGFVTYTLGKWDDAVHVTGACLQVGERPVGECQPRDVVALAKELTRALHLYARGCLAARIEVEGDEPRRLEGPAGGIAFLLKQTQGLHGELRGCVDIAALADDLCQ